MTEGPPTRTWVPEQPGELLSVDSGEVAFVDRFDATNLAAERRRHPPSPYNPVLRAYVVANGVVCDAGGDGPFAFTARGSDEACTEIDVWCDAREDLACIWEPAATIRAASGVLLVADPYLLEQYTVEKHDGPVFMGGLWIELRLPAPGEVVVDLGIREGVAGWDAPSVLRAGWLGDPGR